MAETGRTVRLRTAVSQRRTAVRPAPRWLSWVETLLGRYLRRPVRPGGPERVLARPLSLVRERWLLASRTLLPQIHLAIQPVLRFRLWQARPVLATTVLRTERSERTVRESGPAGRPSPDGTFVPARPVPARLRETAPAGPTVSRPVAPPPLQLVFQRLREPARLKERLATRPDLARRLAGKVRRAEQPPTAALARVVARREAPATGPGFDPPAASRGFHAAAQARWNGPAASVRPLAPQPAVNVEALADRVMQRIDDRLHAWRERTGF